MEGMEEMGWRIPWEATRAAHAAMQTGDDDGALALLEGPTLGLLGDLQVLCRRCEIWLRRPPRTPSERWRADLAMSSFLHELYVASPLSRTNLPLFPKARTLDELWETGKECLRPR